jgi:hypothetical protein
MLHITTSVDTPALPIQTLRNALFEASRAAGITAIRAGGVSGPTITETDLDIALVWRATQLAIDTRAWRWTVET